MKITKIQDNGNKFIIHGEEGTKQKLEQTFNNLGLGISVTQNEEAEANILYTKNNRDIVLKILQEKTR